MAMGEKLYEEKGKMTMTYVDSVDANEITMKQSYSAEVMGVGRFPSGMSMGSGTIWVGQNEMAHGKWFGMMVTKDNETIVWKGTGNSKRHRGVIKGLMVLTFMTKSDKYDWMNSIIVMNEIEGNMMEFKSSAFEWV